MHDNDKLLREIANTYVERYGLELKEELAALERANLETISELRLEKRVRGRIAAQKRKPYLRVLSTLAAGLVIVLILPRLWGSNVSTTPTPSPPAQSAAPAPAAPAAPAPAPSAPAPAEFPIIPLSVPLPAGFTQIGFEQDKEKTIYFISDIYLDDVVIMLEEALAPPHTDGLVSIDLGGSQVYGTQTSGYSLLTFERDSILYTLTSRHDINTLLRLGRAFV